MSTLEDDVTTLRKLAVQLRDGINYLPVPLYRHTSDRALRQALSVLRAADQGQANPDRVRRAIDSTRQRIGSFNGRSNQTEYWTFQAHFTAEHRWIRVGDLCIDLRVHGPYFDESNCQNIVDNFDPAKIERIGATETATRHNRACACDQNHPYVCLGGRHRLTAMKRLGLHDWEISAIVVEGPTNFDEENRTCGLLCAHNGFEPMFMLPHIPAGPGARPPASERAAISEGGPDSRAALEGGGPGGA